MELNVSPFFMFKNVCFPLFCSIKPRRYKFKQFPSIDLFYY